MAQNNYALSSTWIPVATGAGDVTIQFEDHPGEFAIIDSASPAGIVSGFKQFPGLPVVLPLISTNYLHLRGRGRAYVSGPTLV